MTPGQRWQLWARARHLREPARGGSCALRPREWVLVHDRARDCALRAQCRFTLTRYRAAGCRGEHLTAATWRLW